MATAFPCPHCGTLHTLDASGLPPGASCSACGRPLDKAAIAPGTPPPAARRAPDRYADYLDQPEDVPLEAPPIPGAVRAAGIIWIVFGGLILLNFVVQLLVLLTVNPQGQRGGAFVAGNFCGVLFMGLVGGAFVNAGIQSLSGAAKDTLGNGIGSIAFGVIIGGLAGVLLIGILGATAAGAQPGELMWIVVLALLINSLAAIGLLVAGILALVGREGYREYRRYRRAVAAPRGRR
jgi:hypothetical protein